MIRRNTILYLLACVALGCAWYLVLSCDPEDRWVTGTLANRSGCSFLSALVISSVAVGLLFRRFIRRWSVTSTMALGCALTFVGATIDLWIWLTLNELAGATTSPLTRTQIVHVYAVVTPFLAACFVVTRAGATLPMGIASVFVLQWIERWSSAPKQAPQ